jgi:hypothetical protein
MKIYMWTHTYVIASQTTASEIRGASWRLATRFCIGEPVSSYLGLEHAILILLLKMKWG